MSRGWWGRWEYAWEHTYWKYPATAGPINIIAHLAGYSTVEAILSYIGELTPLQRHELFGYMTFQPGHPLWMNWMRNRRIR